ncbi:MAG TPA: hypothetical protein VFD41_00110 [Actinomycetales bacterium]|nr:hypothetical protein [Actinomycetales bacterium]
MRWSGGRWTYEAADEIRQSLRGHLVDRLTIIVAPVVLGGGKRPPLDVAPTVRRS